MEHQHGVKADDKQQTETCPAAQASRAEPTQTHALAHLHQTIGNRVLGHLVQAKLSASQSEDVYEREADEVASRIDGDPSSRNVSSSSEVASSRSVEQGLASSAGGGAPLPDATRAAMESRFGVAFDGVRVHTNDEAVNLNREMNADAFTHGSDIYFGAGQFNPGTSAGQHLLAHELTHVVQQGAAVGDAGAVGRVAPRLQLKRRARAQRVVEREPAATPDNSAATANESETRAQALAAETAREVAEAERLRQGLNASYEADIKADVIRIHSGFEVRGVEPNADALAALDGRGLPVVRDIERVFKARYKQELRPWLVENIYKRVYLVKALANLRAGHGQGDHVRLGLAIIPSLTSNDEVQRILSERNYEARVALEKEYNETFWGIGKTNPDTLEKHLAQALYGWDAQKARAYLWHELTPAEHVYFLSYGFGRVKGGAVVELVQAKWSEGFKAFEQLDNDWANYVVKLFHFTDDYLYDHLERRLWFGDWRVVQPVLDAFYLTKRKRPTTEGLRKEGKSEQAAVKEEDLQLIAAYEVVKAASGITRLGTNEAQVQKALLTIYKVWQRRIKRAAESGNEELRKRYEEDWWKERDELAARLRTNEIPLLEPQREKTLLYLAGDLTPPDEIWAGIITGDYDKTLALITQIWAQGQMDALRAAAASPRRDGRGDEIRPAYTIEKLFPGSADLLFQRVFELVRADRNDVGRGVGRLVLELRQGNTDSDLLGVYNLLSTRGLKPELRRSMIELFARGPASAFNGKDANEKFLNFLAAHYERGITEQFTRTTGAPREGEQGSNYWKIKNLLAPATTGAERAQRARQEKAATEKGFLAGPLKTVTNIAGALSGERYEQVTDESLQRLDFVAAASLTDLQPLFKTWGVATREELAAKVQASFEAQLDDLRSVRATVTQLVAGAVEVGVEAGLSLFTGGAGLAGVIGSMVAAVANIGVQEALLGTEYKAVSAENAKAVLLAGLGTSQVELKDTRTMIADLINEKRTGFLRGLAELEQKNAVKLLADAGHYEAAELLRLAAGRNLAGVLEGEAVKLGARPIVKQAAAEVANKTGAEALQVLAQPRYRQVRKLVEQYAPPDTAELLASTSRLTKAFGDQLAAGRFEEAATLIKKEIARRKDLAKRAASITQNALAAMADSIETSLVSTFLDATLLDKYPSVQDIAAEAYKLATYTVARPLHGGLVTYQINPGKLEDYLTAAERLKINVIFKVALKVSQGTAKDIATVLASDTSKLSLADIAGYISQKLVRGLISTVTKATATTGGQLTKAYQRRADVEQLVRQQPRLTLALAGNIVRRDPTLNALYLKDRLRPDQPKNLTEGLWLIRRTLADKETFDSLHKELAALAPLAGEQLSGAE